MIQLACHAVTLCYHKTPVVKDLSFEVNQGEMVGIVGENGTGKSTLLKGILGVKNPTAGQLVYTGKGIGYLPQSSHPTAGFPATVQEVLCSGLVGWKFACKQGKQQVSQVARQLDLEDLLPLSFETLSGGQQQRVLLARAFIAAKDMLVLDEPVTGLDPAATSLLYDCIKQQNRRQKTTVLMVSHHIDGVLAMADKVLHLGHTGYFFGTVEEYLLSHYGKQFLKGESICG